MDILLSFVGNRDPYVGGTKEFGPLLTYLQNASQQQAVLVYTSPGHLEQAKQVEALAAEIGLSVKFTFIALTLDSPIDYEEIYKKLIVVLRTVMQKYETLSPSYTILLDPGTPQMQTCWFLLARSGVIKARLIQGIPARFAGGSYKSRTINLESTVLPQISPAEIKQMPGHIRIPSNTEIIGEAPVFTAVKKKAVQLAPYDISILILGQTGTGKEVFADLIHQNSRRSAGPFTAVNCGALTPSLLGSELFGHKKGAFTGAETERLGYFRASEGGTIFLDEIGDLPAEQQAMLLRVLENRQIIPVGADKPKQIDVRIIAATNRDLHALIKEGSFREDLYQRISQTVLELPGLAERGEDITLLAAEFISSWNKRYGENKGLAPETWDYLKQYPWPGNIRELQNAVRSLCAMGSSSGIGPEYLPGQIKDYFSLLAVPSPGPSVLPPEGIDYKSFTAKQEKQYFRQAIEQAGGNKAKAAELLGYNPAAFRKAVRERHPELD